jgi:7,8-dihydropterin-6-yl-methyl-4-(beta-D-ribofuranosyl)aminobenzene 5'-phosphate synthase
MDECWQITVLADNLAAGRGLRGEHGLALWLERAAARVLFDTGQGLVLGANAARLGVPLARLEVLALSHGHYDHSGGLAEVLAAAAAPVAVHVHPAALEPKFRRDDNGAMHAIGMPAEAHAALTGGGRHRLRLSRAPVEIAPGLFLTGEIPRRHAEEEPTEAFCSDPTGQVPDPLSDDQALFLPGRDGTTVLLGCAHAGLINTLEHVSRLTDERPIRCVLGGLHLRSTAAGRLAWTVAALRRLGAPRLVPGHCTGWPAWATLRSAFPDRVDVFHVGLRLNV